MPETLTGAWKISDFIDRKELHSRKQYQQFLLQLDVEEQMMLFIPDVNPAKWCELAQTETILSGFILNRPTLSFTERDRSILNLVQPHLLQAYTNARCHHQVQQNLHQLQQSFDGLGIAIVNIDGRIQSLALAFSFASACASMPLPCLRQANANSKSRAVSAKRRLRQRGASA